MSGLTWLNLDAWQADLEEHTRKLVDDAQKSFEDLAKRTEAAMKQAAPAPRDGRRAATIHTTMQKGGKRWVADIGPTVAGFSLVFDEFGAYHTPAHPWARPALDGNWAGWNPWP